MFVSVNGKLVPGMGMRVFVNTILTYVNVKMQGKY